MQVRAHYVGQMDTFNDVGSRLTLTASPSQPQPWALAWISTGVPSAAKNSSSESLYAVRPYLCSGPRPYCPLSPRPLSRQICCFCHDQSSARCTHTPCCKSFSMPAVQSPCTHPQTAGFCCEMRMESMGQSVGLAVPVECEWDPWTANTHRHLRICGISCIS